MRAFDNLLNSIGMITISDLDDTLCPSIKRLLIITSFTILLVLISQTACDTIYSSYDVYVEISGLNRMVTTLCVTSCKTCRHTCITSYKKE